MSMKFFCFLICFIVLHLSTATAEASILSFKNSVDIVQVGEIISVQVILDTQGEQINALEGELQYSKDTLSFLKVIDGNSVINFWVQQPILEQEGVVLFSGITPGGVKGRDFEILTLQFEAKKEGIGSLLFKDMQVLLHDGIGTPVVVTIVPYELNILGQLTAPSVTTQYIDTEPPEPFTPIITSDSDIFSNKKFIVFSTEDKGSGIESYQIKEGNFGRYEVAVSPYEIKDQSLSNEIFIKAIDREKNEYIAVIYPQNYLAWYQTAQAKAAILILCIFLLFLVSRHFFKKLSL